MSPIARHVILVRKAWRAPAWLPLNEAPTRLTATIERACIERLRPWWARLASVRERYDRSELNEGERARMRFSGQRRAAGFDNTPMTELEREAAWTLYTALVAFVVKLVANAHRCFPFYDGETIYHPPSLEDSLAGSYELFLQTLSAYDPDRGAKLISFVCIDLPSKTFAAIKLASAHESSLPNEEEPEALFMGDVECYLDWERWAESFTRDNPQLRAVWKELIARDL